MNEALKREFTQHYIILMCLSELYINTDLINLFKGVFVYVTFQYKVME